jgi:hypothetical protein
MIFPPPRGHARPIPHLYPPRAAEAETVDYVLRVRAAGSDLSAANARAVDALVRGLKAAGLWPALKACCLLAGPDSLAGALVPLAAGMPAPTNFNFVAGDYSRTAGLVGNGSSKYLDAARPGNADAQDNHHAAVYISAAHSAAGIGAYLATGVSAGSAGATDIGRSGATPTAMFTRSRSATPALAAGAGAATGLAALSRAAGASYTRRVGGASAVVSQASEPGNASSYRVFRFTDTAGYTTARLAFYSIGEAIDLAALDALVSAYVAALV